MIYIDDEIHLHLLGDSVKDPLLIMALVLTYTLDGVGDGQRDGDAH